MTEQMPKEQYEYIKRIQDDMLECTNMTENEAWDFAFRCWQCGYNKINKELEQYRALGTVEELRVARDKQVAKKPKYQKIEYGKHKWKRKENGEIDDFAWDFQYCNGVVCEVCGDTYCVYCNPDYDNLEDCVIEYWFCPNCNEKVGYTFSHCARCNQKLDWSDEDE